MMDMLWFWRYNQSRIDKLCSNSINTRVLSNFASGCLCTYGAVVGHANNYRGKPPPCFQKRLLDTRPTTIKLLLTWIPVK